jgi:hypothetical protein
MRLRVLLLVSVLLNAAMVTALVSFYKSISTIGTVATSASTAIVTTPSYRTNTVVRRENFTWDEIESSDFQTYIANLRRIGCPEPTIRDIIVTEVNALFEKRRALEIITPEQQWWRVDPDPAVAKAAAEDLDALEKERRALLTELLGPNWDTSRISQLADFNRYLDGPVLGKLPLETKEAIRQIEARGVERRQAYLAAQQAGGNSPDARELARLRQETRGEMGKILNPAQLEEYLLRYSYNGQNLREETRGLGISPDEFRKIFRARDEIDQQIQLHFGGDDAASAKARVELEGKREAAVKEALGPERYDLYRYVQDPLFRQAQAVVEEVGAKPEAVLHIYEVNQAADEERRRLRSDASLSTEQRTAALERMVLEKEEALRKILGTDAYEQYRTGRDEADAGR